MESRGVLSILSFGKTSAIYKLGRQESTLNVIKGCCGQMRRSYHQTQATSGKDSVQATFSAARAVTVINGIV
jgi:hypothetical protein